MFTELYIEALLVDDDLADQVWEQWNAGFITDEIAVWAWWLIQKRLNELETGIRISVE